MYDDSGRLAELNFQFGDGPLDRTLYFYDEVGWHLRTMRVSHDGTQAGSEMTIIYDERDLPTKVVFQDADHNSLRHVTFVRDSTGKLLSEEMHLNAESTEIFEKVPPEEREKMEALFKNVWGNPFTATTYAHDARGRMVERLRRMGTLGEHRTT